MGRGNGAERCAGGAALGMASRGRPDKRQGRRTIINSGRLPCLRGPHRSEPLALPAQGTMSSSSEAYAPPPKPKKAKKHKQPKRYTMSADEFKKHEAERREKRRRCSY